MEIVLQTLVLIGSLAGLMWAMLKFMLRDIHRDLQRIETRMDKADIRIDHLYQICVDMLKEKKS
jgi:hypothetical protein